MFRIKVNRLTDYFLVDSNKKVDKWIPSELSDIHTSSEK